jgi:membrane protein required for colicin V production
MSMNWIDISIITVVSISILTGLFRGFVKEAIALCTWIIAIWLAFQYTEVLDVYLKSYLQDETIRNIASFMLILIATLLLGSIVNAILSFILRKAGLGGTDRLLGMGFGLIRGVLIVSLIMLGIKMSSLPYQKYRTESKLYASLDPIVNTLYQHMPEFIKKIAEFEKHQPDYDLPKKTAELSQDFNGIIYTS